MNEKKCKGCGAVLQDAHPEQIGYVPDLNQDFCKRCYRLTHYNDALMDTRAMFKEDPFEQIVREKENALFVYVIDVLTMTSFLQDNYLSHLANRKVLLIINKIDLLPRNANMEKVTRRLISDLQKTDLHHAEVIGVLLTRKNDPAFNDLFYEEVERSSCDEVVFLGSFNAGKSTLINQLIGEKQFTESYYPGTTLAYNAVKHRDITFYDSPGSIDEHNFLNNVPFEALPYLINRKTLKPRVYQLYEPQSYIIEKIFRLDVDAGKGASVIFYLNPELDIHRTKKDKADDYQKNHMDEFKLVADCLKTKTYQNIKKMDFEIDGFGFITLINVKKAVFYVPNHTAVYQRKVLL